MILDAKPSNNLVPTKSFEQVTEGYSATDYGFIGSNVAAAKNAWNNGLTATVTDWYVNNMTDAYTKAEPVTQEIFDKSYARQLGVEYRLGETVMQLQYRIEKKAQQLATMEQQNGKNRGISNLVTSFGTGFVDPLNIALMMATGPMSAGLSSGSKAYANARLAAAAGKPLTSAFHSTKKQLQDYMLASTGFEFGYAHMQNDLGVTDYTYEQGKNAAIGTMLFAAGITGLRARSTFKKASEVKTRLSRLKEYRDRMDGTYKEYHKDANGQKLVNTTRTVGDNQKVIDVLQTVDVAADTHVRALINENPRLKQIAERKIKADELTDQDIFDVGVVLHQHEVHVLMAEISQKLASNYRAKEGSVVVNEVHYRNQLKRINDAVVEGSTSKLTPEDAKFLQEEFGLKVAAEPTSAAERSVVPEVGLLSYSARNMTANSKRTDIDPLVELQNRGKLVGLAKSNLAEYKVLATELNAVIGEALLGKAHVPIKIDDIPDDLNKRFANKPLGRVTFGELGIEIADIYTMFEGDVKNPLGYALGARVGTTVFHEITHQLQDLTPKYYAEIEAYINSKPELRNILVKEIEKISVYREGFYDFDLTKYPWLAEVYPNHVYGDFMTIPKSDVEKVPLLMEWFFTRPEFLNGLKKDKPKLFERLMEIFQQAFEKAVDFLRLRRKEFFKDMDNLKDADNVAATIQEIVLRMREEGAMPNQLAKLRKGISSSENLTANSQAPKAYQPSYKNPNFEARAKELGAQQADNIGYLEKRIADIVGDEALVPLLLNLPKQSKGEAGRREHIAKLIDSLEDAGLGHVVPAVDTIVRNLQGSAARKAIVTKALRKDDSADGIQSALNELLDAGAPSEAMARIGSIMLNQELSPGQRLGKISQYLAEEDRAMVVRLLHNKTVEQSFSNKLADIKTKKDKLKQLKTLLDGSLRQGVQRGPSVQKQIEAQIVKDQSPIIEYLVDNDMLELFLGEDPTKYMSSYFNKNFKTQEAKKIYGDNLEKASLAFHMDIMQSIRDGETVSRLKGIEEFENFIELIKTTNRGLLAEINRLGINIRESKSFTGYSMKYDRLVVEDMGKTEFYNYMMKAVDAQTTARLHGGFMVNPETQNVQEFVLGDFVKNMYKAIMAGEYEFEDVNTPNKSIAGVLRKSSKIAFKPEYQIDALVKFSNFKSHGRMLLDQIRGRSEKVALIKNLGHDPYQTLKDVAVKQALTKTPGFKTFDMTAKQITGMLDNPVDVQIARSFQKVRQGSNILYLAGSGASALSDIPLTITTLQYLDADFNFTTFVESYKKAIDTQFRGNNKQMAAWYRSQGAGFDLLTRTIAQKVVAGEKVDGGMMGFANQLVFEINGLNRVTATHQQLFIDILSSSLAEAIQGKKTSGLIDRLEAYGFTPRELGSLVKHVETTPDGVERLAPSSITNAKLQAKVSAFYLQYMKEAVMEPDAGAQALARLGFEAGTFKGEVARTAFQYSSFMLGMARVVYRRFLHGYTGENKANGFKMAHLVTYLGMAIAFAYMTTILKDLSKFKEPINPLNMTQFDFLRILKQSGVLTIGELGVDSVIFGPSEMFSPITGQAIDLLKGDFAEGLEPFTGQQYPIIGPVLEQAVGFVAGETMLNIQKDQLEKADNAKIAE